jgi:hypothetical protein
LAYENSTISITSSTFLNTISPTIGAQAVQLLIVEKSNFINNSGVLFAYRGVFSFQNSIFSQNTDGIDYVCYLT